MSLNGTLLISKKNRQDFLRNKKSDYNSAQSKRAKANIIIELIQLEPTHLYEPWILNQVVFWLNDWRNSIENLKEAFVSKGLRDAPTNDEIERMASKAILSHKADDMVENNEVTTKTDAYRKLAINSDDDTLPDEAERAIKKRIMDYKNRVRKRQLPYPYFGKDIIQLKNKIVFMMDNRMISYKEGGQQVYRFENWKFYHE